LPLFGGKLFVFMQLQRFDQLAKRPQKTYKTILAGVMTPATSTSFNFIADRKNSVTQNNQGL